MLVERNITPRRQDANSVEASVERAKSGGELLTSMTTTLDYDVESVTPHVGYALDEETQSRVTAAITKMQQDFPKAGLRETLFDPSYHKVGHTWLQLSKRAVALNILYDPTQETLAGDIRYEAFDTPFFAGKSARQIMLQEKGPKSERIFANYKRLIETVVDDPRDVADAFGLRSQPYLAGVPDSIAVRLRAATAVQEIVRYGEERTEKSPLKIVSLACGAAGPIFKLLPQLEEAHIPVDTVRLVDWDVMALASAASMAEHKGLLEKTEVLRRDLLRSNPQSYVHDADVVDVLGLFEYFPSKISKFGVSYDLAPNFIRDIGRAMKPGSLLVMGNMLKNRPHQSMFEQVWPKLEQRSVQEMVELLTKAGFPKDTISVRLPHDGVYAIYAVRIPEQGFEMPEISRTQAVARRLLLGTVKEY